MKEFLRACAAYAGGDPSEELRQLTGEFLRSARDDASLVEKAAGALKALPPRGTAWLAVAIGAAVEDGANAELSARPLVERILSWLPQLPAESGSTPTPAQVELLDAFKPLARSAVAHLARTAHLRSTLAQDLELLDRLAVLEEYSAGAAWIREMLLRSSGSLILLHPPSGRGFRVQYTNVATCFHLFSLLQTAIGEQIPGGRKPDSRIAEVARGRAHQQVSDEAWWHYGDPHSNVAALTASVWGEALVREIPVIDGERVILLWPPILVSRGWDSSFFGPQLDALAPDAVVQSELSTADCTTWFAKLGIRRGRRFRWWPW